jgi:lipase
METGPLFISVFGLQATEMARTGSGNVLCLHGVAAHGLRFLRLAELLPGRTIIAPDLRGHGRSPKHRPYSVEQHVHDLAPLIRRLGPRVILLGHSYGGLLAWELARYAPDQLRALILVDPAISVSRELAQQQTALLDADASWPNGADAFVDLMAAHPATAAWSVGLDLGGALESAGGVTWHSRVAREALREAWRQMVEPLQPSLYRGPTLLVEAGREHGAYVSARLVAALREQLGDRLEHVIVDAPHAITADAPELLAEHVADFLDRVG